MRIRNVIGMIGVLAVTALLCTACQKSPKIQEMSSTEKAVYNTAQDFKQAYNDHNKEEMANLIAESAALTPEEGAETMTKEEFLDMFPEYWEEKYGTYSNKFTEVAVVSPDKAKVTSYIYYRRGGERIYLDWVFVKNDGRWLFKGHQW